MSKESNHHHHHTVSGKKLIWTILLNLFISLAELIGGIISGSMALISDATHNFSDVLSLVISYIANKLTKRDSTVKNTFGYRRSEILAAFFNSTSLIVLAVVILYEAISRLIHPEEINSDWVIYLAIASILVNGLSVFFVKDDAHDNMNIRSAYLHLFSDLMTSIAVLIGGIAMKYLSWYWIDAVFSVLIAVYLIYSSLDIFKSSLRIIMQFTPEGVDIPIIVSQIEKIKAINNIHHVHIWQIDEHNIMFEAHIDMEFDSKISEFGEIFQKVSDLLAEHKIYHLTLQPEYMVQDNKDMII